MRNVQIQITSLWDIIVENKCMQCFTATSKMKYFQLTTENSYTQTIGKYKIADNVDKGK